MSNIIQDIYSGSVIKTDANGVDLEYPNITGLLENSLYIRLISSTGDVLHLSAYEIDKALAIIAGMNNDKADKTDIETLLVSLNGKASNVQLALLEDYINSKADKNVVEQLKDTVLEKADKTDVNSLSNTVSEKADKNVVEQLKDTVSEKADKNVVEQLKTDIIVLQNALNGISDNVTISAIKNQINYLNEEIKKRLKSDDLNPLRNNIDNLEEHIEQLTSSVNNINKELTSTASIPYVQRNVSELNTAITSLAAKVKSKADSVDLASKASQNDVNLLIQRISNINTSTSEGIAELNKCCDELQKELSKKASKNSLDTFTTNFNSELDKKANTEEINSYLTKLTNQINSIDIDTPIQDLEESIHNIETTFNNTLSTIRTLVNTHDRQIQQQNSDITKLKEIDNKLEISASNEWVRVMTPEEYNRLSNNPNYSDGTKNPYAKQPNTIYMLVRYNKPIAVYIGTVLIAEAKKTGPAGFAYNFPIIF